MHDFPSLFPRQPSDPLRAQEESDSRLTREVIHRAQKGDQEALHLLYIRYAPEVIRYVRKLVRDDHEAEDITQDVFEKLMSVIGKYEPREVPFAAWVLRVARNAAIDHLRIRRAIPCEEIRAHTDDRDRIRRDCGSDLRKALAGLPAEQRDVFVLRHIVGLSPVEIASLLGKTESAVHGLHHRGRVSMQSSLRQLGTTPVVAAAA